MKTENLHKKSNPKISKPNVPFFKPTIQKKLNVGSANDSYEVEADRVADKVMKMREPSPQVTHTGALVQRKCAHCEQEEQLQMKPLAESIMRLSSGGVESGGFAPDHVENQINSNRGGGSAMDSGTKNFMESRFGTVFSDVKIHTGSEAVQMSRELNAQAFAVGNDIYFNEGKYNPNSDSGKHLLAHELTHTVQQSGGVGRKVQRVDALCNQYDEALRIVDINAKINTLHNITIDEKLLFIQNIKWIIRCGSQEVNDEINGKLQNSEIGKSIWLEANTAFGGYSGMYPSYYLGAKSNLTRLGVSAVEGHETVGIGSGNTLDPNKLDQAATAEAVALKSTDVLYFYGHQYAQYNNPGLFANGDQNKFIDFRRFVGKGNFSRIKLLISTSCATICKEALDVFTPLFPNAVILGYRKSAPIEGENVRASFEKGIKSLNKPLLLNQSLDIQSIIDVWKSVVQKYHPNESSRLPGYFQGGILYYLESGKWNSMSGTDINNSCKKKGTTVQEAIH